MPPRKRARAVPDSEQDPEPTTSADTSLATTTTTTSSTSDLPFRFFNTTFSTFRVSPLYTGQQPLTDPGLATLSRRLRDTLVGDVVRGVQVGLDSDATLGRAGALLRVEWRHINTEPVFASERKALCLELEYENVTFSALLLPSLTSSEERERRVPGWIPDSRKRRNDEDEDELAAAETEDVFATYPLLLTRLPAPLKSVLTNFLTTVFDCRISPLHLGTRTLIQSWERSLDDIPAKKDVALTFAFELPDGKGVGGLKTMDVVVPAGEIALFLRAGETLPTTPSPIQPLSKQKATKPEESWSFRTSETRTPFTNALAKYIDHHLALDIFRPGVKVVRVVCDAFALSDGRVKVFAPGMGMGAVEEFVGMLVGRAEGGEWSTGARGLAGLVG